jgi:hypothetical protein
MDLHPKQVLEIFNQTSVIQKTPAWFPSDQQVEAAIFSGCIAGHRAEHAQTVRAVPLGKPEDLHPPLSSQGVQDNHVSIVRQNEFPELFLGRRGLQGSLTRG